MYRFCPRQKIICWWRYGSTCSWPLHQMQVSGQIRVLIALQPQKDPRYRLHVKLGGLQCMFGCSERTEKSVAPTGVRTPDRSSCSLVTILNELCWINIHHIIYVHRAVHRNVIAIAKPTRCSNVSNLFCFGITLYMFRTVFPSIITSSRLYTQQQTFVKLT